MRAPPLTPLAAAVMHVPVPERALVVECGDGEAAFFLGREFPSARVRGVDSSAARVAEAGRRVGLDREGRIAFKQGSARHLPYPDGFFDLVVRLDLRPAASQTARVLSPGGHLILARLSRSGIVTAAADRLLRFLLARSDFDIVCAEPAGDGNFLVVRRRERD